MDSLPLILTSSRLKSRQVYKERQSLRADGLSAYQVNVNKLLEAKKTFLPPLHNLKKQNPADVYILPNTSTRPQYQQKEQQQQQQQEHNNRNKLPPI